MRQMWKGASGRRGRRREGERERCTGVKRGIRKAKSENGLSDFGLSTVRIFLPQRRKRRGGLAAAERGPTEK